MPYVIEEAYLTAYKKHLILEEKSQSTIEKYMRDVQAFYSFLPESKQVEKETVIRFKESLIDRCAVSTANSMIAALNSLFTFMGWYELKVKPFKQQRRIFRDKEKELSKAEYLRLLDAAKRKNNQRLFYLMETLCATGIRISELQYITVEAVKNGKCTVNCKGKVRTILLTKKLMRCLTEYCRQNGILSGTVFITKGGKPMNRSNVWLEMKNLCKDAEVDATKVFPHNFRHLFAVSFYHLDKDIAKLADLLGHASIDTTRIYIMESIEEHTKQIERLGLVI